MHHNKEKQLSKININLFHYILCNNKKKYIIAYMIAINYQFNKFLNLLVYRNM